MSFRTMTSLPLDGIDNQKVIAIGAERFLSYSAMSGTGFLESELDMAKLAALPFANSSGLSSSSDGFGS